jgi:hypothetical protein
MSRVHWRPVVLALILLPLVSCFYDSEECPTCPPENSGSIGVVLPATFDLDSVRFGLNGPPIKLVRRGREGRFFDLGAGTYTMNALMYRSDANGIVSSRSTTFSIVLGRGESRIVVFHHDFPVITWAPEALGPAVVRIAAAVSAPPRRAG